MKNTYHVDKVISGRRRKKLNSKVYFKEQSEEQTRERSENSKSGKRRHTEKPAIVKSSLPSKKSQYQQQKQLQPQSQAVYSPPNLLNSQIPQSSVHKFYPTPKILYPPSALIPSFNQTQMPKSFFANQYPFNIPTVTYVNDPQYANQFDTSVALPVNQAYPINIDLNANIVTPYRSLHLKGKRQKGQDKNENAMFLKQAKAVFFQPLKKKSLEKGNLLIFFLQLNN